MEVARTAGEESVDPAYASIPRSIEFPTGGGETAYGFFYPPANAGLRSSAGRAAAADRPEPRRPDRPRHAQPRSRVRSGPAAASASSTSTTAAAAATAAPTASACAASWGVVDTDDCVAAARHLAATGEADGERLAIRGGSAGGYATLCALVFHDEFAAGASYYGVADTRDPGDATPTSSSPATSTA